jgi:hypothetical protein
LAEAKARAKVIVINFVITGPAARKWRIGGTDGLAVPHLNGSTLYKAIKIGSASTEQPM